MHYQRRFPMKQSCGKCGTEHEPGTGFCSYCGHIIGRPAPKPELSLSAKRIAISIAVAVAIIAARAFLIPVENTPAVVAEQFAASVGKGQTTRALPLVLVTGPSAPRLIDEYWIDILGERWMAVNGKLQRVVVEN